MRRVALALFSTVTGLVILLGFKTHSPTSTVPAAVSTAGPTGSTGGTTGGTTGGATGGTTGGSGTDTGSSASATSSTAAASSGTKTVTGDSVDTQWGPVQVQITVSAGKITAAQAVVYPQNNPRDQEINAYAVPTLNQEAVNSGSAQIDMVSGATVTSGGYISSLQSALDKAGL
jgi:uncharacterized protein with FMN-binding domain